MIKSFGSADNYRLFRSFAEVAPFDDMYRYLGEGDLFPGWGRPTRFELAVAIHGGYVRAKGILEDSHSPSKLRDGARKAIRPLLTLCSSFAGELERLGVDTQKMTSDLHWLDDKTLGAQFLRRTANTEWIYVAKDRMKEEGLLVAYPDGLDGGSRTLHPSNYEFAVAAHATFIHMNNILDNASSRAKKFDQVMQVTNPQDIDDLARMTSYFSHELASLGVDVPAMKETIHDWKDQIGDLWSGENMRYWTASEGGAS